jgi:hypothetical protein
MEKSKEKEQLEDLGVEGILNKLGVRLLSGFNYIRMDPVTGYCDCNKSNLCSIKIIKYLDKLSDYHLFKKDIAPWVSVGVELVFKETKIRNLNLSIY